MKREEKRGKKRKKEEKRGENRKRGKKAHCARFGNIFFGKDGMKYCK